MSIFRCRDWRQVVLGWFLAGVLSAPLVLAGAPSGTPVPFDTLLQQALAGPAMAEAQSQFEEAKASEEAAAAPLRPQVGFGAKLLQKARDPGFLVPRGAIGNPIPLELVVGEKGVNALVLSAEQLLWDGGKAGRILSAARMASDVQKLRGDVTAESVRFQVIVAVAQWDRALALQEAARAAVDEKAELVRQVQALLDAEQVSKADLLQAQAALALAQLDLANNGSELGRARAVVERLCGSVLPNDGYPAWPALPPVPAGSSEEVARRAVETRPAAKAFTRAAEAQREASRAAKASRLPDVRLEGRAERIDDRYQLNRENAEIALTMRIPLTTGGAIGAESVRREAAARGFDAAAEAARRSVREQVQTALVEDQAAEARLVAAEAAVAAAEEALRLAQLRYSEGLISGRDLLGAEDDAVHARQARAAARSGRMAARLVLRLAAGEPLL